MQIATPALYSSIQSVSHVSTPPALYSSGYSTVAPPPAPPSAVQSAGVLPSAAFQPMMGMQWPQPTPYASPFVAPPPWSMFMPNVSYMPWPVTRPPFLQAHFEELARRNQDMEACELEIQRMSRSLNLKAVKKARAKPTMPRGSRDKRRVQTPVSVSTQLAPQRSHTPSGAPPSGIEEVSQTVVPPTSSHDGASQDKRTAVQGLVRTSLTQLGVIPQESAEQSQA